MRKPEDSNQFYSTIYDEEGKQRGVYYSGDYDEQNIYDAGIEFIKIDTIFRALKRTCKSVLTIVGRS